jgi:hypothetical protein
MNDRVAGKGAFLQGRDQNHIKMKFRLGGGMVIMS